MSALPHGAPPGRASTRTQTPPRPRPRPRPATARGRRPGPRTRRLRVGVLVAVVVLGVLGIVGVQAQAAEVAFDARALEREIASLERSHEQLTAEVAALESPERLRRVALEDLGMVQPDSATYLDLSAPGRLVAEEVAQPVTDPVKQVRMRR